MTSKIKYQQLNLIFSWNWKAQAKFQMLQIVVLTVFREGLRRLAQCSVSETLKSFLFGSFFFCFPKEK
ncbi:hypothetical protein [Megamonas hypermegale]|uniref:hypothetical protein n=1 Tax=Megamonas hypermegale TaxID=158847 RepID=UPI0026E9EBC7|nr:hypothetical protein [Megamonas hypermegale]